MELVIKACRFELGHRSSRLQTSRGEVTLSWSKRSLVDFYFTCQGWSLLGSFPIMNFALQQAQQSGELTVKHKEANGDIRPDKDKYPNMLCSPAHIDSRKLFPTGSSGFRWAELLPWLSSASPQRSVSDNLHYVQITIFIVKCSFAFLVFLLNLLLVNQHPLHRL